MSNFTSRTSIIGSERSLANMLPIDLPVDPTTTLNEKYNIGANEHLDEKPLIRYFGYGIGGTYAENIDGSKVCPAPYVSSQQDMDLFNSLPCRCVPDDEDLEPSERIKYAMRVPIEVNGRRYIAYYLKRIDFTNAKISIVRIDPKTKQETPYDLDPSNLHPTPIKPSVSNADGSIYNVQPELITKVEVPITLTGKEIFEAVRVLFNGDMRYASINEIGVYTGADKRLQGFDSENKPFQYTEAIGVQMYNKDTFTDIGITNESFTYEQRVVFSSVDRALI